MAELSFEDFLGRCSLTSIAQLELSAKRTLDAEKSAEAEVVDPDFGMDIDLRQSDDGFRVRLITRIESPRGVIVSNIGADYQVEGISVRAIGTSRILEFVNTVAIMQIIPYTRQSIADITSRVFDTPLLMPLLQNGELTFSGANE
ncbi:hypothetical protein ADILRU_0758 [Leifsonia rubra CMS 76R]|nr:hypothetical protein ADILRU_0758 [Leifsonia rubra CMS 76R]